MNYLKAQSHTAFTSIIQTLIIQFDFSTLKIVTYANIFRKSLNSWKNQNFVYVIHTFFHSHQHFLEKWNAAHDFSSFFLFISILYQVISRTSLHITTDRSTSFFRECLIFLCKDRPSYSALLVKSDCFHFSLLQTLVS